MSGRSPFWRAILWVERFLPAPARSDGERARGGRRWAVMVLAIVPIIAVAPNLIRRRHELGALLAFNAALLAQVALVVAGCVVVAAAIAAAKAWYGAGRAV